MIRSLRALFLGRALREKLLVVTFIVIALAWWASAFNTRAGRYWTQHRSTTTELNVQAEWIRNRTQIEDTAEKAAARLDPTKTLNANQLATTVQQIASEAGLREAGTDGAAVTRRLSGQFAVHQVRYTIRRADWASITKFYGALQARAPYLGVEQFALAAAANNPAQLTLSLRVASVEIAR